MFCPECGTDHHIADRAAEAAADREVTLAKINADRDIKIAQIGANLTRDTADVDQAAALARAEGEAEGMQTALEGAAVDGQADELGDGAPIVVESPAAEPAAAEPELELEPPPAPPSPRGQSPSAGWWAGYR